MEFFLRSQWKRYVMVLLLIMWAMVSWKDVVSAQEEKTSLITFDERTYTGKVGDFVTLTATYTTPENISNISWECSDDSAVAFGESKMEKSQGIGEDNVWRISVEMEVVKNGAYTVKLTVDGQESEQVGLIIQAERYTVLILDNSADRDGELENAQREAALNLCTRLLYSDELDRVAIIMAGAESSMICDFTDDLNVVTASMEQLVEDSSADINAALKVAGELLSQVEEKATKNIVVYSNGLPKSGEATEDGVYKEEDYSGYLYANSIYNTALEWKKSGYNIYSVGFFYGLSDQELDFARKFLTDIASSGENYYEIAGEVETTGGTWETTDSQTEAEKDSEKKGGFHPLKWIWNGIICIFKWILAICLIYLIYIWARTLYRLIRSVSTDNDDTDNDK